MTYHGCYAIAPIEQVGVPPVVNLRDDIADAIRDGTETYWKERYPIDQGQVRIHYALGNAESMLNSAGKTGSRRIFFVTNNDDPYRGRSAKGKLQKNALEKIKEMRRRGIEFEAFLISTPGKPFSTDLFYADLFQAYDDQTEMMRSDQSLTGGNDASTVRKSNWNAFEKFDDLEKDAGSKEMPKRVVFRLGMELADGLTIGVAGYNTVSKLTKGNPVKVYRENEDSIWREVIAESHLQCRETGALLNPATQVYHAFSLGFDTTPRNVVRFSPEEINDLKTSGLKPTLKVLGFKDRSVLRFWENVKHAIFIFPTEAEYLGSQRAFAALLKAMLAKDKMAIGVFMPRDNSIPEFVAILPQAEERSEEGMQVEPPGMYLIPLPFADDIREMPDEYSSSLQASTEQVEAAARIVKSYTRNAAFNPDFFPNPALTHHHEALKAVAFGVDIKQPVDRTLPDYEGIAKRAGPLVDAWDEVCTKDERLTASKASATASASGLELSDKKRAPVYDASAEEEALNLHAKGQLDKKTLEWLKVALDHYRLPKSGKKAELVDRMARHLDKVMALKQGRGQ
jgi:ATP-dependent DNA helicase 2 subunit 1